MAFPPFPLALITTTSPPPPAKFKVERNKVHHNAKQTQLAPCITPRPKSVRPATQHPLLLHFSSFTLPPPPPPPLVARSSGLPSTQGKARQGNHLPFFSVARSPFSSLPHTSSSSSSSKQNTCKDTIEGGRERPPVGTRKGGKEGGREQSSVADRRRSPQDPIAR